MILSIKARLLTGLLTILALSFGIILVINYFDTEAELLELFDAQIAQAARVLLELSDHELQEQLAFHAQDDINHYQTQIHKYQQEIDFQIWVNGDHLAVKSAGAPSERFIEQDKVFGYYKKGQQHWRVYAISNQDGSIRVQVGQPYDQRNALSNSITVRLMTSFALLLPLLAICIVIIVAHSLNPFKRIAAQLKSRKARNLQAIDTRSVPPEAQPMIQSMNDLFIRLKAAFENIVLFTSNAAHELRTPLAQQLVHAQLAQKTTDEETREVALSEVVQGVKRATNLVEQLLTLSRLDPESALEESESTDLLAVVEENLESMMVTALKKSIDVNWNKTNDDMKVCGKSDLLSILVRNVFENAVRYTPENGTVDVYLSNNANSVSLQVSDSGPGIPLEERSRVFKRFYRLNSTSEGTGLGLAMVKRIAEIHQAQIELTESNYGGLQVNLKFLRNFPETCCESGN
ncbi:MAG: ATP-binding protein [Gammaproteobacteria bacterium]|nr:ATP-binding protein [Gammaproteobacteria bacterium]MDH5802961.1 ATP-binding protein [Gammaproteobacteria bacterium]